MRYKLESFLDKLFFNLFVILFSFLVYCKFIAIDKYNTSLIDNNLI